MMQNPKEEDHSFHWFFTAALLLCLRSSGKEKCGGKNSSYTSAMFLILNYAMWYFIILN